MANDAGHDVDGNVDGELTGRGKFAELLELPFLPLQIPSFEASLGLLAFVLPILGE